MTRSSSRRLPGDYTLAQEVERMIRVNHAGEYGAKRIYEGQLAVLGKKSTSAPVIREMARQEEKHLQVFADMIGKRGVRPTALMPLWHLAGFALGAGTALLGEKAAMACTVAVESVIDEHYARQEAVLEGTHESELAAHISEFREDEKEHHDIALENGAKQSPFYTILTGAVVYHTKLAIWLSTRL